MGLVHTIIIAAGIEIDTPKETIKSKKKQCSNTAHKNDKNNKFCAHCGEELKETIVEFPCTTHVADLIGNENFSHNEVNSNKSFIHSNRGIGEIEIEGDFFNNISNELIDSMTKQFTENHKEDIQLLEEKLSTKLKVKVYIFSKWS